MRHIVIVGGGFCGTLTAVNLARLAPGALQLTLVNHGRPAGRGVAYATRRPEHLLNVAARNMTALPDHPAHFVDWLRTRTEYADTPEAELRETFAPRRVYGDYLRSLLLHHLGSAAGEAGRHFTASEAEVVAIHPAGRTARVVLADGRSMDADRVVLATGNETPSTLPGADTLSAHPAYCANPWLSWEDRLPPAGGRIVLLGTGLTAVDAIVTLLALDWHGTVHAISRHGWLPHAHFKGADYPDFPPPGVDLAELGLDALVRLLEEHCARLRARGLNPAIAVDKLRPHTARIWQAFTTDEKRRFGADYAARWNVLRHRIAPSIQHQVAAALDAGRLQLAAGSILSLEARGAAVRVNLRGPHGGAAHLDGDLVVNCTGPNTRFSATTSPLLRQLLSSGAVVPDDLDLGVKVEPGFAVVADDGLRSPHLLALGPLLRGTWWETIAVPELRGQALRVARTIVDELLPGTAGPFRPLREETVIEYMI
jgi:uncharacterized NAD(P)/FAD-binding protein YdhS